MSINHSKAIQVGEDYDTKGFTKLIALSVFYDGQQRRYVGYIEPHVYKELSKNYDDANGNGFMADFLFLRDGDYKVFRAFDGYKADESPSGTPEIRANAMSDKVAWHELWENQK